MVRPLKSNSFFSGSSLTLDNEIERNVSHFINLGLFGGFDRFSRDFMALYRFTVFYHVRGMFSNCGKKEILNL